MRHIASTNTSLLLATLVLAAACSQPKPTMPPPDVTVAAAVDRQVADWDEFSGHFEAIQSVEVRPRVSGFIQRVTFPEGATVRQGDPPAPASDTPFQDRHPTSAPAPMPRTNVVVLIFARLV